MHYLISPWEPQAQANITYIDVINPHLSISVMDTASCPDRRATAVQERCPRVVTPGQNSRGSVAYIYNGSVGSSDPMDVSPNTVCNYWLLNLLRKGLWHILKSVKNRRDLTEFCTVCWSTTVMWILFDRYMFSCDLCWVPLSSFQIRIKPPILALFSGRRRHGVVQTSFGVNTDLGLFFLF